MTMTLRLFLIGVLFATLLAMASDARAQVPVRNADGQWETSVSGRAFNSPMGAVIDAQRVQSQQLGRLFAQMATNDLMNAEWRRIGRGIIERNQATTRLHPLDAQMARRAAGWGLGQSAAPADVEALAAQTAPDLEQVRALAARRRVDVRDLSELLALSMRIGYERMTGETTTAAQQAGIARDLRRGLLTDPLFQGQGQIAAELQATRFASAIASVERVAAQGHRDVTRDAGAALLQALWRYPVSSIEPTADGFVDSGQRTVAGGGGSVSYSSVLSDRQIAEAMAQGRYFRESAMMTDAEEARAREAWVRQTIADLEAFRAETQRLGLPANDLGSMGATAVALLWPIHAHEQVSPAAVRSVYEMVRADIVADPNFQRLSDAERQRVNAEYVVPAMEGLRYARERDNVYSQNLADSKASGVLANVFAPRPLASVRLRGDRFEVVQ